MRMFVARSRPSIADWPVPYWLSNMCFVRASFTATIGYASTPSAVIARSRITPVVVSSVPPFTFGSRSRRVVWSSVTTSAPSSIVIWGLESRTASMWRK